MLQRGYGVSKKRNAAGVFIPAPHYPFYRQSTAPGGYRALLGIGGNVGDTVRRFEHLYTFLVKSSLVTVLETSPILRNPPFGYLDQEDFYNAVIDIRTPLRPMQLLHYVLRVEKYFGRKRSFANAPRTLDIDILFYENRKIDSRRLTLPHPHWRERDSVIRPLEKMKGTLWLKRHL